jgi:peptidyl-prolyl cis-trans isomerase D
MAVLQKLRGWGIVLSILVALPLLLFIIDPSQIMQTVQSVSSRNNVGKINGKPVSYMDFQQDIDRFQSIAEIVTGNSASGEEAQKQARDAAWQDNIDRLLFIPTAEAAGIQVGKEEMLDLTAGESVSPIMANNPYFVDESGAFSADRLRDFIDAVSSGNADPRFVTYWNYLQNAVKTGQYYSKYNALFTASNYENPLMLAKAIEGNNNTADVEFVMIPVGYAVDTTVVVSDKEIRAYYDNHKNSYRQQAGRDVEYAVFEVVPSDQDIAAEGENFTRLYDEFAATENVRAFLQRNSDRQWSDNYYKAGELNSVNKDVEAFVASHSAGTSPVIQDGKTYYAARIIELAQIPDSVYVRHIMLRGADAQHLADSLLGVVNKGNFSTLAALYSDDKGSNDGGELGNIGWLTQSYMIPGFESVITAKPGVPYQIKTQYGTHIVEVTKTTKALPKKKVAIFEKETLASKETFNTYYNKANRLATLSAGKYENYKAAIDSVGTYSHPQSITEATDSYGAISHAKEITRWAFDHKEGQVSNIITVDNNYFFVVAVTGEKKEGLADVKDVSEGIRNILYREKYAAHRAEEIAAEIAGMDDLQAIAEKYNTTVSTQNDVAFAAMSRSLDPKFIGAIAAANEGELSGPVAGNYGVYVFKVTGRETGAYYTEDDAKQYNAQFANYTSQMIVPVMMQAADVEDHRARFF